MLMGRSWVGLAVFDERAVVDCADRATRILGPGVLGPKFQGGIRGVLTDGVHVPLYTSTEIPRLFHPLSDQLHKR